MKTIAFFNNKGGVGKTSLVYHLAWMYADLGMKVVAADLDPQANLTSMFLDEERLEEIWPDGEHPQSILGAVRPILRGTGDIAIPHIEEVADGIGLIVGDLGLSRFEDRLSDAWPRCLDKDQSAFRVISAFYHVLIQAAQTAEAALILIDVGPNLGAINRAVIIATEYVVIPLVPDLFSLQGLQALGAMLRDWRSGWSDRLESNPDPDLKLPKADMRPVGYVIRQNGIRLDRPNTAYWRWLDRIPAEYRRSVLNEIAEEDVPSVEDDLYCLSLLKHYRSLMPMAMEARKPMFSLKPADGAIGAHVAAVRGCYQDFKLLALQIANRTKLDLS